MGEIDWTDPNFPVSRWFHVNEALYLPQWSRMASSGDGLTKDSEAALIALCSVMDQVRDFIGIPIIVHCMFRPERYNLEVGGAPASCHIARSENGILLAAMDWHASVEGCETIGESCDVIRSMLIPKLEGWGLRMEDHGLGANWIHLDTRPVPPHGNRYFKP